MLVTVTPRFRVHRDEVLSALVRGNSLILRFASMKPMRIPIDDLTDEAREWLLPALAPREIFYGKAEDDEKAPHFTTWSAKFDDAYRKKWGIRNGKADPLPEKTADKLARTARLAYRLFKIDRGIVRLDVRVDEHGVVFVIEVNPNPSLARGDDFAQSAKDAGLEYETLIQRILDNALRERV